MKNRLLLLVGILILLLIFWATTMLGIEYKQKNTDNDSAVICVFIDDDKIMKTKFI